MNILVTGCAGFIGASQRASFTGMLSRPDNLNDYYDPRLKEWRLNKLRSSDRFAFHKLDVADSRAVEMFLREHPPEAVVNLAARAGVRPSLEIPLAYYQTNVVGTLNLLEACRKLDVKKFILASTSSVYGDGTVQFSEDLPTDNPVSPYAASKKAAEVLPMHHNQHGLDVCPPYFTVYGPAGRPALC
jgi:nucleoside-diphosphate-sugar epimerase